MGKITRTFATEYNVGDVVIFKKTESLRVGIVEGYYESDGTIWYNIRVSSTHIYSWSNGGDVAEFDIIGCIHDEDLKNDCSDCILNDEDCTRYTTDNDE